MAKIYKQLTSPTLAAIVFLLITLATLAGALADSELIKKVFPVMVSGKKIFTSNWFLVLNIVLFINTLLCAFRQTISGLSRWRRFAGIAGCKSDIGNESVDDVCRTLKKYRYNVQRSADGNWIGSKNRLGVIGAPLFHFGLMILVFGVLIDVFAGFTGNIVIRPLVIKGDQYYDYVSKDERVFHPEILGKFQLLLHDVKMKYNDDGVISSGQISVIENGQVTKQGYIDRNSPVNFGLISLLKDGFGYYVNYTIFDSNNGVITKFSLGLDTKTNDSYSEYARKEYCQPDTPYIFSVNFLPNTVVEKGTYVTKGYEPKNQAILLNARYNNKIVYNGLVKIGREVVFDNGHRFVFHGVEPYLMLRVQWMMGSYVVGAGFILFLIGLLVYYFYVPVLLFVKNDQSGLIVEYTAWTGRETIKLQVQEINNCLNRCDMRK
jgi:cytochrome c biogenesis protein ResB